VEHGLQRHYLRRNHRLAVTRARNDFSSARSGLNNACTIETYSHSLLRGAWLIAERRIVTTDIFAFDTSNNYFKLQSLGQVCDMGDATVGRALANFPGVEWYAIRNASDPQVPMNGTTQQDYRQADAEAGSIYRQYGGYTTAASVVATWAIIASSEAAGAHTKKH
jgi:hypothetical protein